MLHCNNQIQRHCKMSHFVVLFQSLVTITLLTNCFPTISSKLHPKISIDSKPTTGFTLNLISADSPHSPLYHGKLTNHERIERLVNITRFKDQFYLQQRETASQKNTTLQKISPNNIKFLLTRDFAYFGAAVGIGEPPVETFLLVDTGGGLIWTQCTPCRPCIDVRGPSYNPGFSHTYRQMPCTYQYCQEQGGSLYQCVDNRCTYDYVYGADGGKKVETIGVAGFERFVFSSTEGHQVAIDNVIFGCSGENHGFDYWPSKSISGIMGMSRAHDSFVSQLYQTIESQFSHCIPDMNVNLQNPIPVYFGSDVDDTIPPGTNFITTPILQPKFTSYYYLGLEGISVGNTRLNFPKDTFQIGDYGHGGIFIDSGAPITLLSQSVGGVNAYATVLNVFKHIYDGFRLPIVHERPNDFELCYAINAGFGQFQTFTYHFRGNVDYVVEGLDVHYFDPRGFFCVAILPTTGQTSILGAWHQQNKRIVYDLNNVVLKFAADNCQ